MDDKVKKIDTPEKCEVFAKNCIERGRDDLAREAKARAVQLRAEAHGAETDAECDALKAVYAYEEMLSVKKGKKQPASRTWQMIKRYGIIGAVERAVNLRADAQGYKTLVDLDLQDYAFENIVLQYPSLFGEQTVERAKERIDQWSSQ